MSDSTGPMFVTSTEDAIVLTKGELFIGHLEGLGDDERSVAMKIGEQLWILDAGATAYAVDAFITTLFRLAPPQLHDELIEQLFGILANAKTTGEAWHGNP